MFRRLSLVLAALFFSQLLSAEIVTQKFNWSPVNGIQRLRFDWNDLAISEIRFDLGDTFKPLRVSSAKAVVRVDNNSARDQEVGVALAIFDADGTMLAAGSGGIKVGDLDKGERDSFTVRFPYVYRNLKSASYFYLTVETKPTGKWKYQPKAKPTEPPSAQ
ncbi:MAG TPA: hypothetical protein VGA31_10890 [Thermoanaerobaculia bacterium]